MKKMQNYIKRGHVGSRDQLLEFWVPLISHAGYLKFGIGRDGSVYEGKVAKIRSKGVT